MCFDFQKQAKLRRGLNLRDYIVEVTDEFHDKLSQNYLMVFAVLFRFLFHVRAQDQDNTYKIPSIEFVSNVLL